MIGIGAMVHYLGGGSPHAASEYVGQTIAAASIEDNRLRLGFGNGKTVEIFDNGQSCCESRYMTTDDDIQSLVGHQLARIEVKDGPIENEHGDPHETCFVEVGTDHGFITLTNHNEHNGYYGGFGLSIHEIDPCPPQPL